MKVLIPIVIGLLVVGCGTTSNVVPNNSKAVAAIEKAIRKAVKKPTGELTKADYEKVTYLDLAKKQLTNVKGLESLTQLKELDLPFNKLTSVKSLEKLNQLTELFLDDNQLTDVKGLEKLTQLKLLNIADNTGLTKAQIDELQRALPKCYIQHNAK